jgi:hypothetical protein
VVVDGVVDVPHARWRAGLLATMGRTDDGWAKTITQTMRREQLRRRAQMATETMGTVCESATAMATK